MKKKSVGIKHTKKVVKPLLPPPSFPRLLLRAAGNVGLIAAILVGSLALACLVVDQMDLKPDHPLYPFERLGERIRLASPQDLLQERVSEYTALMNEGKSAGYGYLLDEISSLVQKVQPSGELAARIQSLMPSVLDAGTLAYREMLSSFAETGGIDPELKAMIEEMVSENADIFQGIIDEIMAEWEAKVQELRGKYEQELAMQELLARMRENLEKLRLAAIAGGKEASYEQLVSRLKYLMWLKSTIQRYKEQLMGLAAQVKAGLDRGEARKRLEEIRQSFRAEWEERLREQPEAYYAEYLTAMRQFDALASEVRALLEALPPVVKAEEGQRVETQVGGYEVTTISGAKTVIDELTSTIVLKSVDIKLVEDKLKAALDVGFEVKGKFNYSGALALDNLISALPPSDIVRIMYTVPILKQMFSSISQSELERIIGDQMSRLKEAVREIVGQLPPFELQNVLQQAGSLLQNPISTNVSGVTISIFLQDGTPVLRVQYSGTIQSGGTTAWVKELDAKILLYGLKISAQGATINTTSSVGIEISGSVAALAEVPVVDLMTTAVAGGAGESSTVTPSLQGLKLSLSKTPAGGILLTVDLGEVSTSLYGVNVKVSDLKARLHLTDFKLDLQSGQVSFALGAETGVSGKVSADAQVAVLDFIRSIRLEDIIVDQVNNLLTTKFGANLEMILSSPICQQIGFTSTSQLKEFISLVEGIVLDRFVPKMPWTVQWVGQKAPIVKVLGNEIRADLYGAKVNLSNVEANARLVESGFLMEFDGQKLKLGTQVEFGVWTNISAGASFDLSKVLDNPMIKGLTSKVGEVKVEEGKLVWRNENLWRDLLAGSIGARVSVAELHAKLEDGAIKLSLVGSVAVKGRIEFEPLLEQMRSQLPEGVKLYLDSDRNLVLEASSPDVTQQLWGFTLGVRNPSVKVVVSRISSKLADAGEIPFYVENLSAGAAGFTAVLRDLRGKIAPAVEVEVGGGEAYLDFASDLSFSGSISVVGELSSTSSSSAGWASYLEQLRSLIDLDSLVRELQGKVSAPSLPDPTKLVGQLDLKNLVKSYKLEEKDGKLCITTDLNDLSTSLYGLTASVSGLHVELPGRVGRPGIRLHLRLGLRRLRRLRLCGLQRFGPAGCTDFWFEWQPPGRACPLVRGKCRH